MALVAGRGDICSDTAALAEPEPMGTWTGCLWVWKAVLGPGSAGRAPRAHVSQQCGHSRAEAAVISAGGGGAAHVRTHWTCVGTYMVRVRVVWLEITRPTEPGPWGKGHDLAWNRGCAPYCFSFVGQLEYLSVGNLFVVLLASKTKLTSLRGRGKGDWFGGRTL